MKKIIVSILAVFYLTSTIGATVHLHYCMDKLIKQSLFNAEEDKCGKCGMEKDSGCCKDEQKLVKNNTDQKTSESTIQLIPVAPSGSSINLSEIDHACSLAKKHPISHAPPGSGSEIYLRNCVFRI